MTNHNEDRIFDYFGEELEPDELLDEYHVEAEFKDELDAGYDYEIVVAGLSFFPSQILEELDVPGYRERFNDWLDANMITAYDGRGREVGYIPKR